MDTERRTVTKNGREIPLLAKEFSLLEYMVRNKGAVLSREQMEDRIWNYEYSGSSNNIDVYISRLRKKLEGGSGEKLIHTVRGAGWVLRDRRRGMTHEAAFGKDPDDFVVHRDDGRRWPPWCWPCCWW